MDYIDSKKPSGPPPRASENKSSENKSPTNSVRSTATRRADSRTQSALRSCVRGITPGRASHSSWPSGQARSGSKAPVDTRCRFLLTNEGDELIYIRGARADCPDAEPGRAAAGTRRGGLGTLLFRAHSCLTCHAHLEFLDSPAERRRLDILVGESDGPRTNATHLRHRGYAVVVHRAVPAKGAPSKGRAVPAICSRLDRPQVLQGPSNG